MPDSFLPGQYKMLQEKYGEFMEGIKAEGAVHSHTRRAIEAGATPDEIRHAVILLTSTLGFPAVSMALTWIQDVLKHT